MNSHAFQINKTKMMLSLLAYNLTNWLQTLCFPKRKQTMQMETIWTRIIKMASKLVKSDAHFAFKLSSSFMYQEFFWKVLQQVQQLKLESTTLISNFLNLFSGQGSSLLKDKGFRIKGLYFTKLRRYHSIIRQ